MIAFYHRKTKMYLISSFNSLTAFNYSPHFIITTNSHMWGTFECILSDTRRPILSECKLHQYSCRMLRLVCGHWRHTIVAKLQCINKYLPQNAGRHKGFQANYTFYSEISNLLMAIQKEENP